MLYPHFEQVLVVMPPRSPDDMSDSISEGGGNSALRAYSGIRGRKLCCSIDSWIYHRVTPFSRYCHAGFTISARVNCCLATAYLVDSGRWPAVDVRFLSPDCHEALTPNRLRPDS